MFINFETEIFFSVSLYSCPKRNGHFKFVYIFLAENEKGGFYLLSLINFEIKSLHNRSMRRNCKNSLSLFVKMLFIFYLNIENVLALFKSKEIEVICETKRIWQITPLAMTLFSLNFLQHVGIIIWKCRYYVEFFL